MTRFNMATPGREAAIRTRPDWLAERFALFERFCLPSVAAQGNKDFTWVIYFDKDTPEAFKDRIEALRREVPFVPYYTGLFPASGWPASLAEVLGGLPPRLLTSRLDNDDSLAVDYMERTRAATGAAPAAPRTGIAITQGFIRAGDRAYAMGHPHNAFISWLEETGSRPPKTALGIVHIDAAAEGPVVQVPGPGGWLQVVHGGNVSNRVRGRRVGPDRLAGRFPARALEGLEAPNRAALVGDAALFPLRLARDAAAGLVRRARGGGAARGG